MISRGHEEDARPSPSPEKGWIKADFHLHTAEDPKDLITYSARDLLHRAHTLGFHALAITLHDAVLEDSSLSETAINLGIRLIPGAELRLEGADVVVLNLSKKEAAEIHKLSDLAAFRQRRGKSALIIAPHPFYVLGGSMGERLLEYIDVFDAVEVCHFHTAWFNRNRRAIEIAEAFKKPLVATSDAHRFHGFGRHYTLIEADPDAGVEGIFEAIRNHCVKPVSPDMTNAQLAKQLWCMFVTDKWNQWQARRAKRG